ncbi:MAG: biotin transporter BioY [Clostridiaceae bacterium]|nr:biotin transporter BioY [Clostridiaceae bacterium]
MKLTVRDLTKIALFTALTAVGAFIKIPLPYVPFTLQVFFVTLSGVLLGPKKGALSQLLYVLIGLLGVPIFTQGGGLSYIFKPTFGYLIAFIPGAYITGLIVEKLQAKSVWKIFAAMIPGLFVIYLIGVTYLYIINNFYVGKDFSLWLSIYYGFIPFIGGDLLSSFLGAILSTKLMPILKN